MKKRFGVKACSFMAIVALAVCALMLPTGLLAQPAPATVHGHVNNAGGIAITKGDVKFTTDKVTDPKTRKYPYVFPLDPSGNYTGSVPPGEYVGVVFVDDKSIDFIEIALKPGDNSVLNFDMTRKEFMDKMTPEEKTALEEYKKKNAEIMAGNAKVANLNGSLATARDANKAGALAITKGDLGGAKTSFDSSVALMKAATEQKPDEAVLWVTLGDAQLGLGNTAAAAARAAHTSPMDVAIVQQFSEASVSFKKAIEVNAASKKPNAEIAGAAYNQLGTAEGKQGSADTAAEAYEQAAKQQPTSAGTYYFNEAATLFNMGKTEQAGAAADKAIAADPKKSEAYYIKGQSLVGSSKFDEATKKLVAPPGCLEAYQMYLQLEPEGRHAKEVSEILAGFGQTINSTFKAGKPAKK